MGYTRWNCYLKDVNGIRFMLPVDGRNLDDASIKMQSYLGEDSQTKIERIAPDLRSWRC